MGSNKVQRTGKAEIRIPSSRWSTQGYIPAHSRLTEEGAFDSSGFSVEGP